MSDINEIEIQQNIENSAGSPDGAEEPKGEAPAGQTETEDRAAEDSFKAYTPPPPDGGFEVRITEDGALQRRVNHRSKVLGICYIVAGSAIFFLALLVTVAMWFVAGEWVQSGLFLLLGFFLALLGAMVLWSYVRLAKSADRTVRDIVYRFYRGYFTVTRIRCGEDLGTLKFYYGDLVQIRETKEFFLLFENPASGYPVDKRMLSPEEISLLRTLLKK